MWHGSHDKTWKQKRKDTKEVRVRRKFGSVPVGFGLRQENVKPLTYTSAHTKKKKGSNLNTLTDIEITQSEPVERRAGSLSTVTVRRQCYSFRGSWNSIRGQRGQFRRRFCCHLSGPNLTAKSSSSPWRRPILTKRYLLKSHILHNLIRSVRISPYFMSKLRFWSKRMKGGMFQ